MDKGCVQIYTGNGKGKTTAALGLTLRAVAAGKKVFIGQFVKGMKYSELTILEKMENVTVKQFGRDCFIYRDPTEDDIEVAKQGLAEVRRVLSDDDYDIVILDEANIALFYNLFSVEELITVIGLRKAHVEIVITGRYAPQTLVEYADLVTEMKEIKHYYTKGIEARLGIEK